LCERKND